MCESDLGWTAGLFEGEGNAKVYIARVRTYNKTDQRFVRYPAKRPSIQVVNTDISLLARFRVIVGVGTVRIAKHPRGNEKMLFHRVEGRKALRVAELLLPYVVSEYKRRQLMEIVNYYATFSRHTHQGEASKHVWASYTLEQRHLRGVAVSEGRKRGIERRKRQELKASKAASIEPLFDSILGTGGVFLRKLRARVADEPSGFVWIEKGRLAGSGYPASKGQVEWLVKVGVRSILTLTEQPLPAAWTEGLGVTAGHVAMADHQPPTVEAIGEGAAFIQRELGQGRPVAVHCLAGEGRTGCVLAGYLITSWGVGAEEAMATLRKLKPEFVEWRQEEAVREFASAQRKGAP